MLHSWSGATVEVATGLFAWAVAGDVARGLVSTAESSRELVLDSVVGVASVWVDCVCVWVLVNGTAPRGLRPGAWRTAD